MAWRCFFAKFQFSGFSLISGPFGAPISLRKRIDQRFLNAQGMTDIAQLADGGIQRPVSADVLAQQ
jgi:hypothetical protein